MAVEIVDIRHFGSRDFLPILTAESSAWAHALRWDYTASARLISACLAEKKLSGYALLSNRQIHGYSFFVYEGVKGLIGDLFVQPNAAVRQHAFLLLEHVIETLKATPGLARIEAQLPHFTFEDLATCFSRHRFKSYPRRFMMLQLKNRRHPVHLPDFAVSKGSRGDTTFQDVLIEPWQRKHDEDASRLLAEVYRGHVDAAINDQYQSFSGAAHLIENIVHLRGCGENLPEASFVAIHRSTGRLAGILAVTAVRLATAHIPQIAVASAFQRRGLGRALLESSFNEMESLGFEEVSLTVTDQNSSAVRFYERIGFELFHNFGAFTWEGAGG
ncbi:MAG: GNAT family N-acetyltransferase [Terriglobia bacterium]